MTRSASVAAQPALPAAASDANHPLRRLRRRRGMTQGALAGLTGLSTSYISMIERGERTLTRLNDIIAIAAALRVSPAELAPAAVAAHPDLRAAAAPPAASVVPAIRDEVTMTRHARLLREFLAYIALGDTLAAGMWLRRTARDPAVSPWLLLDLVAAHYARMPDRRLHQAGDHPRTPGRSHSMPQPSR